MITYPNLYHLKYFSDAVTLGSISGAAQKNLVSHPAISRAISALENHLGASLLEHQKKSFKVTEVGLQVAAQAKILLAAASDFESLSLKVPMIETSILKLGISRSLSEAYLTPLLQDLKAKFPNSVVQVRFGTTHEIIEAVASGSIDLGLTIGSQKFATLEQLIIKKGKFLLVESKFFSEKNKKLDSKSFLLTEPRIETEKLKTSFKKYYGVPLSILYEISSWEVIGQQVQRGLGVGLLPDILISFNKQAPYRVLKTEWFDCTYSVYLHTLKTNINNRPLDYTRNFLMNRH